MSKLTLNTNIASLRAQQQLTKSTAKVGSVMERLSTGLRINHAGDDPAGLSIAKALEADGKVYAQGLRNINDGLSVLNVADSAIQALSEIVIRLEELATQSANGIFGADQRNALNEEAQALSTEFGRISRSTEFNDRKLFDGEFGALRLQAGYGTLGGIESELGGAIGDGSFSQLAVYTTEDSTSFDVALGDLNGDGTLDMVSVGGNGPGGQATIFLGQGNGTFAELTTYVTDSVSTSGVELADLNGDGVLDMVTGGTAGAMARVFIGQGDGTFSSLAEYSGGMYASTDVTLGDVNGDGVLDMVNVGSNAPGGRAIVLLGNGDGTFTEFTTFATASGDSQAVRLGDLDGDGTLDMVTVGNDATSQANIFLGQGDGSFTELTTFNSDGNALELADLNGDGVLDMITAGGGGQATIFIGQGDGTFTELATYTTEATYSTGLTMGDVNGDGVLDMITAGDNGPAGGTTVFLGEGGGTFTKLDTYTTESSYSRAVALGDINEDGVFDMVTVGNNGTGGATVFLGDTNDGVAPLLPFSLETQADALQALPIFKQKLDQLAEQRGTIGAFQSRLGFAVESLTGTIESYSEAKSRIMDADVAMEVAELVRNQVVQQATTAVVAQANQQSSIVLQLLGTG